MARKATNKLMAVIGDEVKTKLASRTSLSFHFYCRTRALDSFLRGIWELDTAQCHWRMDEDRIPWHDTAYTHSCPSSLKQYQEGGYRLCRWPSNTPSCNSIILQNNDLSYSQIKWLLINTEHLMLYQTELKKQPQLLLQCEYHSRVSSSTCLYGH